MELELEIREKYLHLFSTRGEVSFKDETFFNGGGL